ncbi:hypothetical protein pipiens_019224 [Culex pipiens pipiens]|uniref:Uncharacterized protein n=1 Tax=Culex pipiens pipiens TaxID=38569 RepID=A0ABD1DWA4_CULPP
MLVSRRTGFHLVGIIAVAGAVVIGFEAPRAPEFLFDGSAPSPLVTKIVCCQDQPNAAESTNSQEKTSNKRDLRL